MKKKLIKLLVLFLCFTMLPLQTITSDEGLENISHDLDQSKIILDDRSNANNTNPTSKDIEIGEPSVVEKIDEDSKSEISTEQTDESQSESDFEESNLTKPSEELNDDSSDLVEVPIEDSTLNVNQPNNITETPLQNPTLQPANTSTCGAAAGASYGNHPGYVVYEVTNEAQFLAAISKSGKIHIKLCNDLILNNSNKAGEAGKDLIIDGGRVFKLIGKNVNPLLHQEHKPGLLGTKKSHVISLNNLTLISGSNNGAIFIDNGTDKTVVEMSNVAFYGVSAISNLNADIKLNNVNSHLMSLNELKTNFSNYFQDVSARASSPILSQSINLTYEGVNSLNAKNNQQVILKTTKMSLLAGTSLMISSNKPIYVETLEGSSSKAIIQFESSSDVALFTGVETGNNRSFVMKNVDLRIIPLVTGNLPVLNGTATKITLDNIKYHASGFDYFTKHSIWGYNTLVDAHYVRDLDVILTNSDVYIDVNSVYNSLFSEQQFISTNSTFDLKIGVLENLLAIATEMHFNNSRFNATIARNGANAKKELIDVRHTGRLKTLLIILGTGPDNRVNLSINSDGSQDNPSYFRVSTPTEKDLFSYDDKQLPVGLLGKGSFFIQLKDQQIHRTKVDEVKENILVSKINNDVSQWPLTYQDPPSSYSLGRDIGSAIRIDEGNKLSYYGVVGSLLDLVVCDLLGLVCPKSKVIDFNSFLVEDFKILEIGGVYVQNEYRNENSYKAKTKSNAVVSIAQESDLANSSFNWNQQPSVVANHLGEFEIPYTGMDYGNLIIRIRDSNLIRYVKVSYTEEEKIHIVQVPQNIDFGRHKVNQGVDLDLNHSLHNMTIRDTRPVKTNWRVEVTLGAEGIYQNGLMLPASLSIGNCDLKVGTPCTLHINDFNKVGNNYNLNHDLNFRLPKKYNTSLGRFDFTINWKLIVE